jgi:uncharacterized repeat protein (TIGR03803 family)
MSLLAIAAFLAAGRALGAPFTTLHWFTDGADGGGPLGGLVSGTDGNFYGTTGAGGNLHFGTVFQMTSSGSLTTLYSFTNGSDGAYPEASLVSGTDGNFYGTTWGADSSGGAPSGTVFQITSSGSLTTLHVFGYQEGGSPRGGLVSGTDGNFYGTTFGAGPYGSVGYYGTVFQITYSGSLTTLHTFTGGNDGAQPFAGLVQGTDGNFYGTTLRGGASNYGTVFQITSSGSLNTLYSFTGGNDEEYPAGGLVQGTDGNFYGTAAGNSRHGTVFRITSSGSFATIYTFTGGNDGADPRAGLVQGTDGNLYGATTVGGGVTGGGTVFRITTSGSLNTLHEFDSNNDGADSEATLLQGSDGNFYGATSISGSGGWGAIFQLLPGPVYALDAAVVTGTSVNFSASVNPNGFAGPSANKTNDLVSWQYGLVPGIYTASTTAQPIGTGTTSVLVAYDETRSGLKPALYHYRLAISSTIGYTYSPDQTFSNEPATVAYTAPVTTGTDGALSPTVNPNGNDTTVTIAYGLTTACTSGTTSAQDIGSGTAPVTVNVDLTGLAPNTAYYYRVITTSVLGATLGAVQRFTTMPLYGTTVIVLTKSPAPEIPGAVFGALGNPALNDSDHAAFQSTVTGGGVIATGNAADNSGIWADIGTQGLTLIVQTGSPATGYTQGSTVGTFSTLSDPVYSDSDTVAFLGTLQVTGTVTASNKTGIWATTAGNAAGPVLLVARAGDPAPDANGATSPGGAVFASFSQFVLPDQGGVVFLGNLVSGTPAAPAPGGVVAATDVGIWAVDTNGVLTRIVHTLRVRA